MSIEREEFSKLMGVPSKLGADGRHQLSRAVVEREPHIRWNAFIDVISELPANLPLGPKRQASMAFLYESLVQNGGHDSYFHCHGVTTELVEQTVSALRGLGDDCRANVLARAHQFVLHNSDADTSAFDADFHRCKPDLCRVLARHLDENESLYIDWR